MGQHSPLATYICMLEATTQCNFLPTGRRTTLVILDEKLLARAQLLYRNLPLSFVFPLPFSIYLSPLLSYNLRPPGPLSNHLLSFGPSHFDESTSRSSWRKLLFLYCKKWIYKITLRICNTVVNKNYNILKLKRHNLILRNYVFLKIGSKSELWFHLLEIG